MEEVMKRVGRYDVLEVVGRGGAAVVYLAFQRDLERRVALKELAPHHAETDFAGRFVDESRLAASMSHPNVVTVHEYFEDDGVPYIAMEYLPHGSLRQYVGRLSTAQIAGVLEGVLAGLSHGEAHGIVHRDLKPENLLVAADGRVKIADFGVARAYNRATRAVVTVAGTTIGTPAYMSPEQALGGPLTAATDLYSLGVVTWELLTGQVPFEENDTPVAVLYRHVHEPIPSVRSLAPEVDEAIAAWLERMLAKQPEARFPSADVAWLELEDVVLDLLGPRWRRSARLTLEGEPPIHARTLTPASFGGEPAVASAAEAAPAARAAPAVPAAAPRDPAAPIPETHTDLPARADPRTTIAPTRRPRRSNTTMLRIARRHRDGEDGPAEPAPGALRRRTLATAIVLAMAAAAAAGVVLAQPGPKPRPRAAVNRQAAATAAANRQLEAIIQTLASARGRALASLRGAQTPAQQAAGAAAAQQAYAGAARRVAPLAGRTPAAKPLEQTLTSAAGAYGSLAAAAKSGNGTSWNRASAAIEADEQQLQAQVAKL